jgi:hypothetical protein
MSRILSRGKERLEKPKNENYPSNSTTDDNNSNIINELDIADGLKHIIISHGVTVEALLSISPTMIATKFGIDQYVANIIQKAAKYYYVNTK